MIFFHISHTDLDGYTCQLLTKEHFKKGFFYNANYGLEVKLTIEKVLQEIHKYKDNDILFFISDLNLSIQESKDLDNSINDLNFKGFNIKLQVLDHHISGKKSADKFSWYYLDDTRSATKIVYEYLISEFNAFTKEQKAWLNPLVDSVNAVDIWLDYQEKEFEFGKVLMRMVSNAREINNVLFADLNRTYRLSLIKAATKFLNQENGHIKLDNEVHFLKKEYLKFDKDDTLDNLSAKYLVKTLDNIKEKLIVRYKNYKGILTYCLGSISIPANTFLKENQDFDFFIDISKKGNASFRADGKVDVALMAEKLAGGGGHKNASGAKFEDFKESLDYKEVQKYMQDKLNKIS